MTRFVDQLVDSLRSSIEPYMDLKVFIDEERLRPGYLYNEALAEAICQSLCMIAVFVPKYLDHDYCRRELHAMRQVEDRRRAALGSAARHQGFVIPVILRGDIADLPTKIKGHVHCCDFSGFTTAARRLARTGECVRKIDDIAKFIYELQKSWAQEIHDCSTFVLPTSQEADEWKPSPTSTASPQPLREAGR